MGREGDGWGARVSDSVILFYYESKFKIFFSVRRGRGGGARGGA